ncbi:hypothetical protein, partial [Thalassobaculum salexigens]|uniref:hypothetical protein n=1 Tax=Thalassobaculum salexigens TaxID=455360 RepID=UPI00248E9CEE
ALPPNQRPVLVQSPASPPKQFQPIENVSELRVATQRAASILAKLGSQSTDEPDAEDDLRETDEFRGGGVNITA